MIAGLFVDASAFLAIKNSRDSRHAEAMTLKGRAVRAGRPMVTSDYVLDESYTLIRRRAGHRVAVEFGEEVRASQLVRVEHLTLETLERAWAIFKRFMDKDFSFTDCTSFALMQQLGLHEALAFDEHFTQAGFVELRP